MASIGPMTIMTRIGQPGAPLSLMIGQLAYNQQNVGTPTIPGDILYVGDGQNVNELVGRNRQVELWGDQTITGIKTIDITNLKVTGGEANWLIQTDGNGNLTFTNAPGGGLTQVATDGETLSGLGTSTSPLSVVAESVAVAVDGATMSGDGTALHPLTVDPGRVPVTTDGATISGNGTMSAALAVIPNSVAIATSGAGLTGNGTTASPLSIPPNSVAVATNATLSGNGTTASPLGVVAGSVAIVTNVTLSGNGTTANPLSVVAGQVAVIPDGVTVTGNGTAANPLKAIGGAIAVITDGTTISGEGVSGSPLAVIPNSVAVATNASLIGNGTIASPLGLNAPVSLQNGGTGVSTSSNAALLTALGAASITSLAGYLPLAGGTMTGALVLSGNATQNLNPVPLQQLTGTLTSYAPLASPTFTGTVTIPSGASISGYATLASPTFTGAPASPTPPANDNSTRIATTAWVDSALGAISFPSIPVTVAQGGTSATTATAALANLGAAPIASPSFTGTPTAPTPATADNSTNIATTAFIKAQGYATTAQLAGYLPLAGGTITGSLTVNGTINSGNTITSGVHIVASGSLALASTSGIYGPGFGTASAITVYATTTTIGNILFVNGAANGPSNNFQVQYGGSVGGNWNVAGTCFAAAFTQTSDEALKTNFAPVDVDCLGVINAIALQQFDWHDGERGHASCGVIAQDIERLIPEAVSTNRQGMLSVELMPLIGYLVRAVQQLTAEIKSLRG